MKLLTYNTEIAKFLFDRKQERDDEREGSSPFKLPKLEWGDLTQEEKQPYFDLAEDVQYLFREGL